jgi:hypothetical protein
MFLDHTLALGLMVFARCFHFLLETHVFRLEGLSSTPQLAGGISCDHTILTLFKNPDLIEFNDTFLELPEVVKEMLGLDNVIHKASLKVNLSRQGLLHAG